MKGHYKISVTALHLYSLNFSFRGLVDNIPLCHVFKRKGDNTQCLKIKKILSKYKKYNHTPFVFKI